jgi:hypothetical protein
VAQSNQGSAARSWTTKQLVWGCVGAAAVGAILTYQAGFNWIGQWQTGGEVQKRLAISACVENFLLQPDRGVIYATLKDTSSAYQRRKLIQDSELASAFDVADSCDEQIRALDAALFPPA